MQNTKWSAMQRQTQSPNYPNALLFSIAKQKKRLPQNFDFPTSMFKDQGN